VCVCMCVERGEMCKERLEEKKIKSKILLVLLLSATFPNNKKQDIINGTTKKQTIFNRTFKSLRHFF